MKWVEAGIGLDSERYMGTQTPRRRLFYLHARGKRISLGITCYFRRDGVAMYLLKTSQTFTLLPETCKPSPRSYAYRDFLSASSRILMLQ